MPWQNLPGQLKDYGMALMETKPIQLYTKLMKIIQKYIFFPNFDFICCPYIWDE